MQNRFFYSADGELLIVPQLGSLNIDTELGRITLAPLEIAVIPRGLRFRVELCEGKARGYVCENFGAGFKLPDLGPLGSNGLANPRDFLTPSARFEDIEKPCTLIGKFCGRLWAAAMQHSPLDVVAWHGNNAPYKYDLGHFNTMGSTSYDHPDPSIFLVLHAPSDTAGTSNLDFVVFPPRWLGDGKYLSAALVSSQYRQRVHGADSRRIRCEGDGIPSRWQFFAQLHERARARFRDFRQGVGG